MEIKETLIAIRESKGYSKRTVSEMTGIPYTTYIKYESGERKDVSMQALCKLADFYGTTTDYLLGRPSAKPPEDPVLSLCNAFRLPEQDRAIVAAYLYMTDKDRAELLRLMKKLVENSDTPKDKQIQQIKLVPQAARGGERPGLVETTDEENAKLLSAPLEDFDL